MRGDSGSPPSVTSPLVDVRGLRVAFDGRPVLDGVDLLLRPGEVVTLIGPNGAGKTTLVRAVLGLVRPAAGRVLRRPGLRVGYLPQRLSIDPTLPLTVHRFLSLWHRLPKGAAEAALAEVGASHLARSPVQSLSGGETRRVLLARALLGDPELLVLDEPDQGVDVHGQADLYHRIDGLRRQRGCGVLLISHDLHTVMARSDRVLCLNRHVCCEGPPEDVSRHPEYRALFGVHAADLAVYRHHHDHAHGADGAVMPLENEAARHG